MRKKTKWNLKMLAAALLVVMLAGFMTTIITQPVMAECETAILPKDWCDGDNDIMDVVKFVANTLGAGITVVGIIGIVICGVTYLTARDNEAQVAKAKKRLMDVIIGLVIWILFWAGSSSIFTLLSPTPAEINDVNVSMVLINRNNRSMK